MNKILKNRTKPIECLNFTIKLTRKCNFCCAYCFEHAQPPLKTDLEFNPDNVRRMLENIRTGLINLHVNRPLRLRFILHGGEPYLYPPSFFRDLFVTADNVFFDTIFEPAFCIQTNGAIPLYPYLSLLKRWRVSTGVSFDYGATLRKSRGGATMKKQILKNAYLLKEHGLNPSFLTVISTQNNHKFRQLYAFFKRHDFSFCLLRMIADTSFLKKYEATPLEFAETITSIADIWLNDYSDPPLRFGNMLQSMRPLLRSEYGMCWQCPACEHDHFCIRTNGDVVACDCAANTERITGSLGNIFKASLDKIALHPNRLRLMERSRAILRDHKNCRWLNYCWGGCPAEGELGDYFKCSTSCETIKHVYSYIENNKKLCHKKMLYLRNYGRLDE